MEHSSDRVSDGKLLHTTTYPDRAKKFREVELDGIKLDFYDPENKVIHEIKRSNKIEQAHQWQVKYYIYRLKQSGIKGVSGLLEYPTLRQTEKVELKESEKQEIQQMEHQIKQIVTLEECPQVIHSNICKNCSYYDFCYSTE